LRPAIFLDMVDEVVMVRLTFAGSGPAFNESGEKTHCPPTGKPEQENAIEDATVAVAPTVNGTMAD
jgi:hypothetical protein